MGDDTTPDAGTPDPRVLGEEASEFYTDTGRELRIALAMRGGVSLAVWIGGAMAELDLARRGMIGPEALADLEPHKVDRATAYADLLRSLGYTGLRVDVLAGASAGGLNAVVYGFAQSVGTGVEWLRDVWQQDGGLWTIFHPQWDPADRDTGFRTEAILSGDGGFYAKVLANLAADHGDCVPSLVTEQLTIDLAATLQSGPPLADLHHGRDVRPRTAHFRFRRTPAPSGSEFNDLPSPGDIGSHDELVRQLAYAARSTSSFPGAFEPATIFSHGDGPPLARPDDDVTPRNMRSVFSEVSTDPATAFDVMDGGVFDNIPIERTFQAIADAPATGPTQRILIYLDPSPPPMSAALEATPAIAPDEHGSPRRLMRARFIRSALTALKYKRSTESSTDDIRELLRLRARVTDIQKRRNHFLGSLPEALSRVSGPTTAQRYAVWRAGHDAGRFVSLLMTPGAGFLRALVRPPVLAAAVHPSEAEAAIERLTKELRSRGHCHDDATALLAATDLFIGWIRRFQDNDSHLDPAQLASAKGMLYFVRTAALHVRHARAAAAAAAVLGTAPDSVTPQWIDPAADFLRPTDLSSLSVDETPLDYSTQEAFWSCLESARATGGLDLQATIVAQGWHQLCAALNSLAGHPSDNDILVALSPEDREAEALTPEVAQFVTMAASLAAGDLDTSAVADLHVMSGDEPALSTAGLDQVIRHGAALSLDGALGRPDPWTVPADRELINASSKLSGNQLANFAGFLSSTWRMNDWEWGRRDASAALLRTLRELNPCPEEGDDPHLGAFATALRRLTPSYAEQAPSPKPGLADLDPGQRFALATRLVHGITRAVWPITPRQLSRRRVTPAGSSADGNLQVSRVNAQHVLSAAALLLIRPAVVLLPLALRPVVLVGVVLLLAVSHHLHGGTALPTHLLTFALVIAAVTAAARAYFVTRIGRRWQRLTIVAGASSSPQTYDFSDEARRTMIARAKRSVVIWSIVTGLFLTLVVVQLFQDPNEWRIHGVLVSVTAFDTVVLLLLLAVLAIPTGELSARSLVSTGSWFRDDFGWVITGVAVALAVAMTVMVADASTGLWVRWWVIAITTAVVVWCVHDVWSDSVWGVLIPVVAAGWTWCLQWLGHTVARQDWSASIQSGWSDQGPWDLLLDVLLLIAAVVGAISAVWLSQRLRTWWGVTGFALGIGLVVVASSIGAWLLIHAWGLDGVLPHALVVGGAICASTTLAVPYVKTLND